MLLGSRDGLEEGEVGAVASTYLEKEHGALDPPRGAGGACRSSSVPLSPRGYLKGRRRADGFAERVEIFRSRRRLGFAKSTKSLVVRGRKRSRGRAGPLDAKRRDFFFFNFWQRMLNFEY